MELPEENFSELIMIPKVETKTENQQPGQSTFTKWKIDKVHSAIYFKAKHLMITTVTGTFKNFDAEIETEGDDFSTIHVLFTLDTHSINTRHEKRDNDLKSEKFLYSDKYPQISFKSGRIEKKSEHTFIMSGDLTIRDITKPVKLDVEFGGTAKDHQGNVKAGFNVKGTINRKDFGLSFNAATDEGIMIAGDEVRIEGDFELAKA